MSEPITTEIHPKVTLKQKILETGSSLLQTNHFKPIQSICAYLCALHAYAKDPKQQVIAHHYCTHYSKEVHQCLIYDSAEKNARLIGIEYLISARLFETLPEEEKIYWHSHQFEVSSGLLVCPGLPSVAEREFLQEVTNMYGKIIHTWAFDQHPDLPIGPPSLMVSLTKEEQIDRNLLSSIDQQFETSKEERMKQRLDLIYNKMPDGIDMILEKEQRVVFEPKWLERGQSTEKEVSFAAKKLDNYQMHSLSEKGD